VVAVFIQKMIDGDQPLINGDGEQARDFVYVEDVAKANILAMKNKTGESIFNIGTGIETSVNQIFNYLKGMISPSIEKKHGPAKLGEQRRSLMECSKAKRLLKWEPQISLVDGLKSTHEYFKEKQLKVQ
jgi:UDP-glucose 4-epimerase